MKPGEARVKLRAALVLCKRHRGDSPEHLKACWEEVLAEPESTWPFWIDYFNDEAEKWKSISTVKRS